MDQPTVGNINYSPDYHSVPASQCFPNGIQTIPVDPNSAVPSIVSANKEYYIQKVRKLLEEFIVELDELDNSDVVQRSFSSTVDSHIRNQRFFLTEQYTKKLTYLFLNKENQ